MKSDPQKEHHVKALQSIPIQLLLLVATTLEVSGDAVVRLAIYNHAGLVRVALLLAVRLYWAMGRS